MPEKTNSDEWEEIVILKGIPAAGKFIHKDRLLNDDCNRIAEIIIDEKNSRKITAVTQFHQNAELHTLNQALSNELALYRNILMTNITVTLHDIQSYIIRDVFPIAMPTLEKLSPKVFHAQPVPPRDAVINNFPKPEKPIPKYADREPQLSDERYSYSNSIVAIAGVIFLMSAISISFIIKYVPESIIAMIFLVPVLFAVAAMFCSLKIDAVTRRFNPFAVRAFKADCAQRSRAKAEFAQEWETYLKQFSQWEYKVAQEYEKLHDAWKLRMYRGKTEIDTWNKKEQQRIDCANDRLLEPYTSMLINANKYLTAGLQACDEAAINDYFNLAILMLKLPYSCPEEARLRYLPDRKALLIFFRLPSEENVLSIKEFGLSKGSQALLPVSLNNRECVILYENILRQIALSVISHLFACDKNNCLETIFFQGWLRYLDKSVGKMAEPTVMTLQVSKELASSIDFSKVDPVECFNKRLRGVCATKFKMIVPVQPIIIFDKNDPRFVSGYDVISTVNAESNLATMEWQDFENLVRDLFEKKYCNGNQEVKITQSSRDKGVDAVLFDTDPIRGGKIIIQAKRYINTVPVSAVRDLYGTVMSEGANRGILVTTSHYGGDSYEFAKNKPITLLAGNELLSLLLDIGVNARIDLEDARILNASSESA